MSVNTLDLNMVRNKKDVSQYVWNDKNFSQHVGFMVDVENKKDFSLLEEYDIKQKKRANTNKDKYFQSDIKKLSVPTESVPVSQSV